MKNNKKNKIILLSCTIAALVLVGVMLLLIFLPDSNSSNGSATYDEGTPLTVEVDEDGMHQAKVITDSKGELDNNSYGTLVEYDTNKVIKVNLENSKGTMEITSYTPVNDDGETDTTVYTITGYEDFELQSGMADEIANDCAQVDFTKVISVDGSNSSEYGFDSPAAKVQITYEDNTTALLTVGDAAPQETGTYVKFGTSDTIYLVANDDVAAFYYGLTDMFSLTINDSADTSDNSIASSITLGGSRLEKEITFEPNSDDNISSNYVITSPEKAYASETVASNIEGDIRGLYAESVVMVSPSDEQLKTLGLATPYATVKGVYPDATVEVLASKPDSDGYVNLMLKGGDVIYRIASDNVTWVQYTYEELLSEYMIAPNMIALSAMSVNDGSNTYDYKLSSTTQTTTDDDGEETTTTTTTVKCGNTEIEIGYFTTYFQNISLIKRADGDIESYSGNPVFSVTFTYESGGSDTVSYYNTGGNRYLAVVNGKSVGHVYKTGLNKIISQSADAAANKQVDAVN